MAWDTEETRRKLLDAGARQFAASGFAGARMDRIEQDAGVNRERVYRYFGDKKGFFGAVLARELTGLLDGMSVTGEGPQAVGDLAGRMVDRCREHARLPRLLAWESLELDATAAAEERRPLCAATATGIRSALPGATQTEAEHLLLSLITLAAGEGILPRVADSVLATGPTADRSTDRREAVVQHVTAMAARLVRPDAPSPTTNGATR
jgi:AcrR family transcriptional regulator